MIRKCKMFLNALISCALIFQLVGCGTILYPERKGQTSGRIDPGVALLDAVGLFFFVVPGVIAFAVDFTTGTIYLPQTARASLDTDDIKQVTFDPTRSNWAGIERIIREETGRDVELHRDDMIISRMKSTDDMMMHFAEVLPGMKDDHIKLSMK